MGWRMPTPCVDCPFNKSGPGLHLRKSLAPGRWREITSSLLRGEHFTCHKTTDETGDGSNLLCAGAVEYQHQRGITSQMERIAERLAWIAERHPLPPRTVR